MHNTIDEDNLKFLLNESGSDSDTSVTLEFETRSDKIIVKQNDMITGVVKPDSEDFSIISGILESIT